MKYSISIFSLLFFLGALIALGGGIQIIKLNPKRSTNRGFFAMAISLSLWSLGLGISNSSEHLNLALFWRRFSAIGWTSMLSITLHFLLILTSQKYNNKRRKYLFFLHIPAIISMYIFAFSKDMAISQYNLVKINYGWTNIAVNNPWDYFYYSYYALYTIIGLGVVWKWKNIVTEKTKIQQGNLILASIITAIIFASFTDLIANTFMTSLLPQMAPLFILIPMWAMYYSVRYYDFLTESKAYVEELIVTEEDKQKIFNIITIVLILSGIFIFIFDYILQMKMIENNSGLGFVESMIFILIGLTIYLIQKLDNILLKEKITILILVVSIPIITLSFLKYSGVTVWAFPMILIIVSLVFTKKILLISTGVISIITQILIWILEPRQIVTIDRYNFIFRIVIILTALVVAFYINKTYVARIRKNDFQMRFQKMNSKISSDFITVNQENIDGKINNMLAEMGLLFSPDRICLCLINDKDGIITYTHKWCKAGVDSEISSFESIAIQKFSWWIKELTNDKLISIGDTRKMPKEAINEQEELLGQNVKSLVSVSIKGKDGMKAFMRLDSTESYRKWPNHDIHLLDILANILSDALMKIESEREISTIAYYDGLTKLPNRFLFVDKVSKAIDMARKTETNISLIFIDLDNFKVINDTMGYSCGDYLLKKVADSLNELVEDNIIIARSDGDKFMVLLKDIIDQNEILKLADKLIKLLTRPFNINKREILITASAGISVYPKDGQDGETLIRNAYIAMDQVKNMGKNKYLLCTDIMKQEVQMSMELSEDMYKALENDEFLVYYQPQVDLATGDINGLEALVRWKHPKRGMISPGIFIPLSERNGMINSIGEWVLKTACIQNKKWQDIGLKDITMSVNLSAVQFVDSQIATNIENILKESELDSKYLELEITESIAIEQEIHAEKTLNKLKKLGIRIAIDDFGTEYSSFSRLKELPIDRIKIDIQFTQGIEDNEKDRAIIMVIINLAKKLNMNVIAEGAETKEQVDFLSDNLCDDVQGYYYYKPMPAEEIEKLLIQNK